MQYILAVIAVILWILILIKIVHYNYKQWCKREEMKKQMREHKEILKNGE